MVDDVLNLADHERQQLASADYYSVFMNAVSDAEVRTITCWWAGGHHIRAHAAQPPLDTIADVAVARAPR